METIGSFLSSIIFIISSALLYPTLFLLVAGFFYAILCLGGFASEWMERKRKSPIRSTEVSALLDRPESLGNAPHRLQEVLGRLVETAAGSPAPGVIEHLVRQTQIQWWKAIDRLRLLVRLGPSLGLMGTLIPMGTGLAALGQGDMGRLSSNLVIAFTTTVVGLAIGMSGYWMVTVRRRWIEEDIENLLIAADILMQRQSREE
ncbi:MotA/TolQ/ExbB proton channel family protein [Desulfatirhabdium butyrativorans]|uniref:MotA/TolQ/ExbB proton channel family protein n=1 Tax=Desulfatirhabdium butyrativorans TaxID=340467 RepID=UPI00041F84EC|nr:MotA/TolQ/ExbB proton channel family protein [Desulfatirhabdium butyrativorans]